MGLAAFHTPKMTCRQHLQRQWAILQGVTGCDCRFNMPVSTIWPVLYLFLNPKREALDLHNRHPKTSPAVMTLLMKGLFGGWCLGHCLSSATQFGHSALALSICSYSRGKPRTTRASLDSSRQLFQDKQE